MPLALLDTIRAAIAAGSWNLEALEREPVPHDREHRRRRHLGTQKYGKRFEFHDGFRSFWCPILGKRPVDAIDTEVIRVALDRQEEPAEWAPGGP